MVSTSDEISISSQEQQLLSVLLRTLTANLLTDDSPNDEAIRKDYPPEQGWMFPKDVFILGKNVRPRVTKENQNKEGTILTIGKTNIGRSLKRMIEKSVPLEVVNASYTDKNGEHDRQIYRLARNEESFLKLWRYFCMQGDTLTFMKSEFYQQTGLGLVWAHHFTSDLGLYPQTWIEPSNLQRIYAHYEEINDPMATKYPTFEKFIAEGYTAWDITIPARNADTIFFYPDEIVILAMPRTFARYILDKGTIQPIKQSLEQLFRSPSEGARFLVAKGAFEQYQRQPNEKTIMLFAGKYHDLVKACSIPADVLGDEKIYRKWEVECENLLAKLAPERTKVSLKGPEWREVEPKKNVLSGMRSAAKTLFSKKAKRKKKSRVVVRPVSKYAPARSASQQVHLPPRIIRSAGEWINPLLSKDIFWGGR